MTTKTDSVVPKNTKSSLLPIRWQSVLLLLGLTLLLWLGIKAWRIGRAVQSLLAQQTAVQAMLENGLTNINPADAVAMARTVRTDFLVLQDETAFLMPLTPRLGWVPKVGPLLIAAPELVTLGDAATETAVYASESLAPLLTILQAEDSANNQLPQLIKALADARPGLAQTAVSLDRVAAARAEIDNVADFPDQVQQLVAQADAWLPIAQDSLTVVQILPEIMGLNGRRTYLLLAQNEDELRATGGYISGVGTLTLENGDIQSLTFQNADQFDVQNLIENSGLYDYPPQPLYEIMGAEYFLLRDTNYWPDFPYSAEQAIELYQRVEPAPAIDGVIAIDQEFIRLVVAATGPVTVAATGEVINAQNTIESFRNSFNIKDGQTFNEWYQNRKAFLTTFSSAILEKVQGDFGAIDPIALVQNMHQALASRHLQLYMVNPQETAVLDQLNWDGRLENTAGQDFLLVLDTNMGFNKANMHIERSTHYQIALNADGSAQAVLTLDYAHTHPPGNENGCLQKMSYADTPTYEEIADRCYFDFLRVYTPPGATLVNATGHAISEGILLGGRPWMKPPATVSEFANFTTFTNFMMVPRGEMLSTEFSYTLPASVVQQEDGRSTYQLQLRKQAGTSGQPVTVQLLLPEGSTATQITASSDATINNEGNQVTINLTLDQDVLLTVTFAK